MGKFNTEAIVTAIKAAAQAAQKADPGRDNDGGTCNFDAAFVSVPGMRAAQAEEIVQLCYEPGTPGLRVWLNNHELYGRILMVSCYNGQANRRTIMAEAAKRNLTAAGIDCGMYYQMD
jgi:hypothetical protein